MKTYAPIALFVYNRPLHVKSVIKALKKNYLASLSEYQAFIRLDMGTVGQRRLKAVI